MVGKAQWSAHKVELALWSFHYGRQEENHKKRSATSDINSPVKRQRMK